MSPYAGRRHTRLAKRLVAVCVTLMAPAVRAATEVPAPTPRRVAACLEERFVEGPGPFASVRFSADKAPLLILADDTCLEGTPAACTKRTPLDPARQWLAGTRIGDWLCVTDGNVFGWVPFAALELGPLPATQTAQWLGRWERTSGEAQLEIARTAGGEGLRVTGEATWQSGPDRPPHLGDIGAQGRVQGNLLELGDPACLERADPPSGHECLECAARLTLIDGKLFVVDNRGCGGMNVNFDGIYARVSTRRKP